MRRWLRIWERLRRDSPAHLLVGRLTATMLAFVTAPIVARTIGAEGRGETAAAIALFTLTPILLGIGMPLEVRRLAALGSGARAIRTARIVVIVLLPVSTAAAWILTDTVLSSLDPVAKAVALVGIAACPLMIMWTCDSSVLIATGRYRGVMALQLVQPGAYLVLVVAFALSSTLNVATTLAASFAGTVAAFVTGTLLTRTSIVGDRYPLPQLLRGAVRYAGSSIAEAASSRLDQVIALPLVGALQAGLYSVAVTIASIPLVLGQALGAVFFPRVARAQGEQRRELKEEAIRSASALSLMTAPLLFVAIWIGIPLLFGPEFVGAVPVAWIAGVGTCALIVAYVCSLILGAEGKGYTMTAAQVGALAVSVVLLFVLAPALGAMGAALASSLGYLTLMVVLLIASSVRTRMSWPRPADFKLALVHLVRSSK